MTDAQIAKIEQALADAAGNPKSITIDGETYTQHALSELLAVYNRAIQAKQANTASKTGGIVFRQFRAGGPV